MVIVRNVYRSIFLNFKSVLFYSVIKRVKCYINS